MVERPKGAGVDPSDLGLAAMLDPRYLGMTNMLDLTNNKQRG
jgi:hypothetical protein